MNTKWLLGFGSAFLCLVSTSAVVAANNPAAKHPALESEWPAENLTGSLLEVKPGIDLVIVKGPDGVPFDLRVTPSTRIEMNHQRVKLDQLQSEGNHGVSVRFIPERKGDVAESIEIAS